MDATRERIVVGIDGSTGARAALAWALTEAGRRAADVEVISAIPVDFYRSDPYLADKGRVEAIRSDTEARAVAMVADVRKDPAVAAAAGVSDVAVQVLVATGSPAAQLVHRSEGAALLVVGSRGRGPVRSTFAGSVALHCAAHARCPVMVVHPETTPAAEPARVVVGLDGSEPSRAALALAVDQARELGARVDAVVAYAEPDDWSDLYILTVPPLAATRDDARQRAETIVGEVFGPQAADPDVVRVLTVEGHPGTVLLREAEGARLLVVGSRSGNQLEGLLLGSVALHCVMYASCPVLVVHPQVHVVDHAPAADAAAVLSAG